MSTEPASAPPPKPPESPARLLEWIKAIGMPTVTLLVTLIGGFYFSNLAKDREARESSERLYAQLLTQREQSDALIRKDMFSVVINRFIAEGKSEDWGTKVLQLELLAGNFNQSLDLAPLFKDAARRLALAQGIDSAQATELRRRLEISAANLVLKQVGSLARRGVATEVHAPLGGWEENFGKPLIDTRIPLARLARLAPGETRAEHVRLRVEVVDVALDRREVEVRVLVEIPGADEAVVDRHFWISPYDFPMLDNMQLPLGLRCSVVITDFYVPEGTAEERAANSFMKLHLVVFPAASASFKERQDYDDVLLDMLRARSANAPAAAAPGASR